MAISETQMPGYLRDIAEDELTIYKQGRSVTLRTTLPATHEIPLVNRRHWLRIPDVVCVFVDMKGSTQLSASTQFDKRTAGAYQLFTEAAVRLFHALDAPYIDVRGDGVFALFNQGQEYRAITAAVTFKTHAAKIFTPQIKKDMDLDVTSHIGIDQKTVLVRRAGLKRADDRTDRQNEVWAGKPVNIASKLAAMGGDDQLLVSDRYYNRITNQLVRRSCGCSDGIKRDLWTAVDVTGDSKFDFNTAYMLESCWCEKHGKDYCEAILALDED
jgi:class 3 adenylate cyclase